MEKLFKHPWALVVIIAAITVFFAAQLPKAELDNNYTRFLPDDNPAMVISDYLEKTFGDEAFILIGLERPYGTVFDREFLLKIRDFENAVETAEFVKDFNSIIRTQYISADNEAIMVSDLAGDNFSGSSEEIAELKQRLASWDLYRSSIISDYLHATQILISLDVTSRDSGKPEVMATLTKISNTAREMFAGLAEVYVTGPPVIGAALTDSMSTDVIVLIPLVIAVLVAVLIFSFRKLMFVTLPLLTVIISTIWAAGAMPLFDIKLNILSSILPIVLIAVGSAYGIHLVSHYRDEIRNSNNSTAEGYRELVLNLVRILVKPVSLAALTTFAGFVSFCFTSLPPIREFGFFVSFGVIASFIVAITLIPALLLIQGPKTAKSEKQKNPQRKMIDFDNELSETLSGIAHKKNLVLVITVLVIAFSIYEFSRLVVDNAFIEFFREDTEISRSDRFIREHFGGSTHLTASIEADTTEIMLSPEVLSAVDGLSIYLSERVPAVGKVIGFTDMIKRINQMFNIGESPDGLRAITADFTDDTASFGFGGFGFDDASFSGTDYEENYLMDYSHPVSGGQYSTDDIFTLFNTAAGKHANMSGNEVVRELERLVNYNGYSYYEIPVFPERYGKTTSHELRGIIANYLVLVSGSDNNYSNDPLEPTAIKMSIQIRSQWQRDLQEVIKALNSYVDANFPKNVRVVIGGAAIQEAEVTNLVVHSQIISIFVSMLMVFVIIAISNRSFVAGIIAALPLSVTILCNFAIMSFFGITLNMGTALIGSLVVGIGIDYTIHFIEFFKHEYQSGGDFLKRTFAGSGKAIIINAISVGAGFAVLAFSQFRVIAQFGTLIAIAMITTATVSLTLIPALLTTIKPKFIYGNSKAAC